MKSLALFLVLMLLPSIALAQDPNDPGVPDTVYYEGAGCHSGDTLYISALPGHQDVHIDCCIWTDSAEGMGIIGLTWPQVDRCYGISPTQAFLDSTKNTEELVFAGTSIGASADIKGLALNGIPPTPTPPHFSLGAVHFTGTIVWPPGRAVAGHLCFTVQDTGCICLDTVFVYYPPPTGVSLSFMGVDTIAYLYKPIVKPRCFLVASLLFGDCNSDRSINLIDIILLANYVLNGEPTPNPLQSGDVNCDNAYNLVDAILLARYLLLGEPLPCN